ncbi:MAG: GspE/PulE family protein [Candidatus Paceibacterota bacterium]|jgi:type IV pilus assembly protein PilB
MIQIPIVKLKDILIKEGLVTAPDFEKLEEEANRMGQNLVDVLISQSVITQEYFFNLVSQYFGIERVNLNVEPIDIELLHKLSEEIARRRRVVAFGKTAEGVLKVAMEDPGDLETIKFLEKHMEARIKPYLATPDDLNQGYILYGRQLTQDFKKIIEESIKASLNIKATSLEEAAGQMPVMAIVDNFLSYAGSIRASDVHLEILEDNILVRYRIDGILREIIRIPNEVQPAIIARIKILSGLKVDEHLRPQDGRFRYDIGQTAFDVRVSVLPTFYGEKIAMRLLPATQKPLSLEEVGMWEDTRNIVFENIKKSYGMVLVCGPTGSGKTTTLYSILNILNKPEVNIVTIEDPIEYAIKYINQIQVNTLADLTFANGLRSILRQDPNIVMVGEIRDSETAGIAVNAALTGHLLLSSLHTNDAATSVPRLLDLGIPPFLAAAVMNAVIAQRLVRKICMGCIESYKPESSAIDSIKKQLKLIDSSAEPKVPTTFYRGKGCSTCGGSGYKERVGIFEVLNVTEEVRKLIVSPKFSLDELRTVARKEGMVTIFEDGLRKIELGLTTVEEVLRVMRE